MNLMSMSNMFFTSGGVAAAGAAKLTSNRQGKVVMPKAIRANIKIAESRQAVTLA
jgi:hypothetical protein